MTSWLHAVEDSCELEICKKIRAAEIYLVEPEMPDGLVGEIEGFLATYPYQNEYRDQLENSYLPAMKRLQVVKGNLSDCLSSSITRRLLQNLGVKVKDFFSCKSCQEQSVTPEVNSNLNQIAVYLGVGQSASQNILISDLATTSRKNAINRFVDLQYSNRSVVDVNEIAQSLCKKKAKGEREQCRLQLLPSIQAQIDKLNGVEENRRMRSQLQRKSQVDIEREIISRANVIIEKINQELDQITPTAVVAPEVAIGPESFLATDLLAGSIVQKIIWDDEDVDHYTVAKEQFALLSQQLGIVTVAPSISRKIIEVLDELSNLGNLPPSKWTEVYHLNRVTNRANYRSKNLEVNAAYDFLENQAKRYSPELAVGTVVYQDNPRGLSFPTNPAVYMLTVVKRVPTINRNKGDDAIKEVENAIRDEMKKADELNQDNLHKALLYNPLAVAEVLMKNPGLAPYICSYIHKAEEERIKQQKIASAIYIASAVTGILSVPAAFLSGGLGAVVAKGISAGLAIVSGVLATGMGTAQAINAHNEMQQIKAALASGNTSMEDISLLNETRDEFNSFVMWAIADAGMTVLDVVQLVKSVKSIRQLKQVMAQQDEVAELVRNLKNSSSAEEQAHFWMEVKKRNLFDKILELPQDDLHDLMRTCRGISG